MRNNDFDIDSFISYIEYLVKLHNVQSSTEKFNSIKRNRKIHQVLCTFENDHNVFCELIQFLSENIHNYELYVDDFPIDLTEDSTS